MIASSFWLFTPSVSLISDLFIVVAVSFFLENNVNNKHVRTNTFDFVIQPLYEYSGVVEK